MVDPGQIGVRPTGAYWGAGPEKIDMRSGNLNITMPLLRVTGRGGRRLQAGALTPEYNGTWSIHHYSFTDNSGRGVPATSGHRASRFTWRKRKLYFTDGSYFGLQNWLKRHRV